MAKTSPSTLRQPKAKSLPPSRPTRDGALRKPSVAAGTLDQSLVAAATQAGVGTDTLDEVARLMSKNVKAQKVKDMSPGLQPDPLSDADEIEEQELDMPGDFGLAQGAGDPMERAVISLAEIVKTMNGRQEEEADVQDREHVGGLWSFFERDLDCGIWQAVCSRAQSFETDVVEPPRGALQPFGAPDDGGPHVADSGSRMPTHALSSRAWVEHRSRIGAYKASAHCAWGVAGALDCLARGQVQAARARLNILLLQIDQAACDRGNWTLASEPLPGTPPAFFVPPAALTSGRGRTAVQSAARSEVGRSGYGISTGTGRFPVQAEEPRQEDQERRRGGRKGLPEIQVQADS